MRCTVKIFILFFGLIMLPLNGFAADAASQQKLQTCLKQADDLPDVAAANAEAWFWHGGGDAARLCHDYAKFNSGDFPEAGKGFAALAHGREKTNSKQAASLYAQAGLSFLNAKDFKASEANYSKAVMLVPNDADILTDRAVLRIEDQHYWEAIADLNQVLTAHPADIEALRQRGRAWMLLGNQKKAQADFQQAAVLSGEDPAKMPEPKELQNKE